MARRQEPVLLVESETARNRLVAWLGIEVQDDLSKIGEREVE